jgi:hypothetical protein
MFTNPYLVGQLAREHHRELLAHAAQQRPARPARARSGAARQASRAGRRARRRGLRVAARLRAEPQN